MPRGRDKSRPRRQTVVVTSNRSKNKSRWPVIIAAVKHPCSFFLPPHDKQKTTQPQPTVYVPMRFALFGDHPDGLDMARALVASGRHELATYTGQPAGAESLTRWGLTVKLIRDVEEVLADPSIQAVIVASRLADRPAHLRRALQSERHVLCVHPADQTPDSAYEAALIQGDTRRLLLSL